MPTFREDLHSGHKVPLLGTEDLNNGAITNEKMAPGSVGTDNIIDGAVTTPKIDDGAVTTPKIADGAVTPAKVSDDFDEAVVKPWIDNLEVKHDKDVKYLQEQIDSINRYGYVVSNSFGDDPHIAISQKLLTEAFSQLWSKIEEMTGENLHGISMTVTPTYYIGEEGCDVHITVDTFELVSVFEKIEIYFNGELIIETEGGSHFEYDTEIFDTTTIACKAIIFGRPYYKEVIVRHYSSFWLGAGTNYADVMVNGNLIPIKNMMRGAYDVTARTGDHIIIILGDTLRENFIRADINGAEIPFTESELTVDGYGYRVLTSVNAYTEGVYNIDING